MGHGGRRGGKVDSMQLAMWIFFGIVLKIPVIWLCWFVWRAATDVPDEHVLGDGKGDGGSGFSPGPRKRGPLGGLSTSVKPQRRGNPGHDELAQKCTELPAGPTVREHTMRGD